MTINFPSPLDVFYRPILDKHVSWLTNFLVLNFKLFSLTIEISKQCAKNVLGTCFGIIYSLNAVCIRKDEVTKTTETICLSFL